MGSRRFRQHVEKGEQLARQQSQSARWWSRIQWWGVFLGFFLLGLLVYAPALNGPFQFDDKRVVLDPKVRDRRSFWGMVATSICCEVPDGFGAMGPRAMPSATILANWRLSGMETTAYHVFNIAIHAGVATLVVLLVEETLGWLMANSYASPELSRSFSLAQNSSWQIGESDKKSSIRHMPYAIRSFWLAVVGGLVFLLHPLASQAVAYISQRYVSVTALFYLTSVVFYLKARKWTIEKGEHSRVVWLYLGSFLAAFAALSSKESAVTLPLMLVLMEVVVVGGKKSMEGTESIRGGRSWKVWGVLVVFFLLSLKVPWQMLKSAPPKAPETPVTSFLASQAVVLEKPDVRLTRGTYLLTQFNVIRTYLRMSFLPYGQSIDHDYPLESGWRWWPTGVSVGLHLLIVGLGVYGWWRGREGRILRLPGSSHRTRRAQDDNLALKSLASLSSEEERRMWLLVPLAVGWFFVPLLVESSVIPIRDLMYEHRAYLSIIGFVLLVILLIHKFYDRYREVVVVGMVALLLFYSGLTLARANVWASEVNLWGDAWRKGPEKDRTNKNYGFVLTEAGKVAEGIERLERAVELNPVDQDYRITLGAAYLRAQDWEKAKAQFEKAVELAPEKADGWNNLGVALFQLKDYEGALKAFETSIEQNEDFFMAWLGLGGVQTMRGEIDEAVAALSKAIELEPLDVRSYGNLIAVYVRTEQWQKAWEVISVAEKIAPGDRDIALKKQVVREKLGK